ncbi:hypothetical protein [Methylobacterium soli]|uniref:Uncharacterized protein n=1 Tax=Methylobacterium soli TaxID=553447 RepID=A0A6L3SSQ0_9HYPH|nr:hypothetical protein [Methylobacterium soli]KAB1075450.1 hypothetical protein F6X53_25135 [Methylobacterium soli]GJE45450.1 hypothetical protein AEGHOMDF_4645 [Methylobacterium soli]
MMTEAQLARLPGILREIVDCDRRIAAARAPLSNPVVAGSAVGGPIAELHRLRSLRRELSARAAGLYGRAPLRGDPGPGRPTSARAA